MSARPPVRPRWPAMGTRGVLVTLYVYAVLTLALGLLPPVVEPALRFPEPRAAVWIACSVLSGWLALLLTVDSRPSRRLVLVSGWLLLALTTAQAFVVTDLLALAGLYTVTPVLASLAGRLTGRPRKALVAAHVVASACWIGVALMMAAVAVVTLGSSDIVFLAEAYELMEMLDVSLLAWLNFAASLSGIALGVTTQWGVIRYYWVASKFTISLVILFSAFSWIHAPLEGAAEDAEQLAAGGGSAAELGSAPVVIVAGFGFAFVLLLTAILLSLYKPGGTTRRGRRVLAAQRAARTGEIPVTVAEVREVAEDTVALTLRPAQRGRRLPAWEPGAHVDLVLPSGTVRQYSLYGDPADTGAYRIAVLREEDGRGGSLEVHRLAAGAKVAIRGPRNNFPLVEAPAYVFLAGGIGIVPPAAHDSPPGGGRGSVAAGLPRPLPAPDGVRQRACPAVPRPRTAPALRHPAPPGHRRAPGRGARGRRRLLLRPAAPARHGGGGRARRTAARHAARGALHRPCPGQGRA